MIFNSYLFIFAFFPLFLSIFYALIKLEKKELAIWHIGISSLIFYSIEGSKYLPLLLTSITVNYIIGQLMARQASDKSRHYLFAGICFNLGLLIYFKYIHFLLNDVLGMSSLSIILPIGISFYTFTQIAYLVDSHQHKAKRYSIAEYLCFVTFFPHLIAGPILIHRHFIPQLSSRHFGRPRYSRIYTALIFFSIGMFKKVLIADSISPYVIQLFSLPHLTIIEAWSAALLYTIQLYYDFSAYSEMAVGLALLMNLRIPINFNSPYKSLSIIDFWRRWHISLSHFLKQYLYIPLGGNRVSKSRQYVNLFATMLLGGTWHGAGFTFIIWGALHGAYLCINHAFRNLRLPINRHLAWLITFIAVVVAWVFFRANNVATAMHIVGTMFGLGDNSLSTPHLENFNQVAMILSAAIIWLKTTPNTRQIAITRNPQYRFAIASAFAMYFSILNFTQLSEFIYFQF